MSGRKYTHDTEAGLGTNLPYVSVDRLWYGKTTANGLHKSVQLLEEMHRSPGMMTRLRLEGQGSKHASPVYLSSDLRQAAEPL